MRFETILSAALFGCGLLMLASSMSLLYQADESEARMTQQCAMGPRLKELLESENTRLQAYNDELRYKLSVLKEYGR